MNVKTITVLYTIILLSACGNNATNTISDSSNKTEMDEEILFDQLLGLWANEDGQGYERWTKNKVDSYLSEGFHLKGTDTIYTERVYVHRENGQWISENKVPDQNEGNAIKFTVSKLTADEVNFSNPAHDFPTNIHYHLINKNVLQAYISGPNDTGGSDTISFNFNRVVN